MCAILVAFLNATVRINRGWFIYLGVIAISAGWYLYGGVAWKSFINALLIATCYWTCRFAIAIWMAAFIITSIGTGEVTAALRAILLPKSFVTIITVVLRFIPLTGAELKAIMAALKLRGLVTGVGSLFLHPFRTAEYVMVPLLASLTRVIDDLAAGGVIRGLGTEAKPTSIVRLSCRRSDAVAIATLGALIVWRFLG
ncbi:MAG: energy-coupling factor transporter transmembrane component T [Propionibacteriaceae bacterium]